MPLTSEFHEALAYASRIHRKQLRKGSDVPYIAHLLAVTAIALEHGASENEAIAALLHDAAEDQGGHDRLQEITEKHGQWVARIVEGCSDTFERPKPPWRERKEAFIARLATASSSVRLVVAADKLHNTRDIQASYGLQGERLWELFKGGRDGTLWYYRAVVSALQAAARPDEPQLNALVATLDLAVSNLESTTAESRPPTNSAGALP